MKLSGKIVNLDVDNVYYEVSVPNNGTQAIKTAFNETRIEPILSNTSDWQLLISDFNLPAASIPLFLFENASVAPDYSQGYWISGQVGLGAISSVPVVYSPPQSTVRNTGTLPPYPYNFAIYNYTLFLTQINNALATLWTALGLATLSPKIIYNPATQLFSMYLDFADAANLYDGTNYNGAGVIKIFFNYKLQKFFKWPSQYQSSPLTTVTPPLDYLLLMTFTDLVNVPAASSPLLPPYNVQLIQFIQEFPTISKWMRYTKILFNSSSVPVMNRQVGDFTAVGTNQNFSILTSYELADGELFDRSNISFNSTTANKWISLLPSGPLRTFDINVLFMGATSNDILQGYITPGEKFSFTVWFNRKAQKVTDDGLMKEIRDLGPSLIATVERLALEMAKAKEDEEVHQAMQTPAIRLLPKSSGQGRGPRM